MSKFIRVSTDDFKVNAFDLKKDWALVTAGEPGALNTMTIAWGGLGVLWNKNIFFVPVRPERYTHAFIERHDNVSLTFFNKSHKSTLEYLGTISGRHEDKIAKSGLTLNFIDNTPIFDEAKLTIIGRKLYTASLKKKCFIDQELYNTFYKEEGIHHMYIYEVTSIYRNEENA